MQTIKFFDATLRDGSHCIKHQLETAFIADYCAMADDIGLACIFVGHGNGLGGSSIQIGLSKHSDAQMLGAARNALKKTKLGVYMIPGIGTIADDLMPAIEAGVDTFKIGCHCTEADTTKQHINYLAKNNKEVYGTLMMSHMVDAKTLLQQAQKMQSYGAVGVILFDSAGAMVTPEVAQKIQMLKDNLTIAVGYHGHNNLGLAIANSAAAITAGATIIDGTLKGFGAGAGNCQLDALSAVLIKQGVSIGIDMYKMLDTADMMVEEKLNYKKGITSLSIISGLSGVFSAFNEKVKVAAAQFNVDARDIFIELGKRKVVGGQEDIIIDVAMNLSQKNKQDNTSCMIESLL